MKRVKPDRLAKALVEEVKKFAAGTVKYDSVLRANNNLLKCYGGKLKDESRLAFRDLSRAVVLGSDVKQAANVFIQAMAHEFDCLHAELSKPVEKPKPEPKKPKTDSQK